MAKWHSVPNCGIWPLLYTRAAIESPRGRARSGRGAAARATVAPCASRPGYLRGASDHFSSANFSGGGSANRAALRGQATPEDRLPSRRQSLHSSDCTKLSRLSDGTVTSRIDRHRPVVYRLQLAWFCAARSLPIIRKCGGAFGAHCPKSVQGAAQNAAAETAVEIAKIFPGTTPPDECDLGRRKSARRFRCGRYRS